MSKPKGKYILIYSGEAARKFGYNQIKTVDGTIVSYTCMTENHDWKPNYGWKDAKEVGYADSTDDIVQSNIKSEKDVISRYTTKYKKFAKYE